MSVSNEIINWNLSEPHERQGAIITISSSWAPSLSALSALPYSPLPRSFYVQQHGSTPAAPLHRPQPWSGISIQPWLQNACVHRYNDAWDRNVLRRAQRLKEHWRLWAIAQSLAQTFGKINESAYVKEQRLNWPQGGIKPSTWASRTVNSKQMRPSATQSQKSRSWCKGCTALSNGHE